MERMLQSDTWISTIFNFANTLRSSPPEDKINEAVKLFDSRKKYFHFLLTTDVWNCEEPQQQPRACSGNGQNGPTVELVLEPNINSGMEIDQGPNAPTSNERGMVDLRKLDDILRWLDGLNCGAKQEEALSLHQPGTCTWLNSTPEYKSWGNSDDASLWLQGKPGSGKTVLASFVVESLKKQRHSAEILAFFYCDFRNDRSTSAAEVMRSLLSQLLRHVRDGNIDARELVDDLVREKDGDTPILKNVKHLATFVSQTAKQFSHQPLVVIDALDECKDVEKLLDGLLILTKGGMQPLVTSRPLLIIKDGLRGFPSISLDKMASAISTDIALHVTRELDSRRRLRDLELGLKMEIHSVLCDRADGMFRWVQCQIDTLNQCATRTEVREALDDLPIGLDETYQRILVAIDTGSPEGKLALRALVWLVGALRPLRLVEILDGLTLDLERRVMDADSGPMHKGALLDACGSLVTYNEDTGILILSHFSVKEYLTGGLTRVKLPRYHISYQGAHEQLARLCICYVTLYLKHVHRSGEKTTLLRIMRTIDGRSHGATGQWTHFLENPPAALSMSQELLGYVFTDGFNHLGYLGSANHVVLKDMVTLQSDIQRHPTAWEVIRRTSQRYNPPVPWPGWEHDFMLYMLTAFGSDSLLHAFLGHSRKMLKTKYHTNPLVYAAHFGKVQHAKMLLSRGAKVNERGLVVDGSRQALPLEVAVSRQHDAIVDLLLSTGSIVPNRLFTLCTNQNFPIRIARRLLQTDEFMEWALEPGNRLPSPVGLLERRLPLAYERDLIIMMRRLVQAGLDPAARNSTRKTALHHAIAGGYQAVVVYLLLIGAPLPFDFMSAVSRATSSERMLMLRLIVDAGGDVGVGEDPALHLAVKTLEQDECLEAAKILVGAGCKPFGHDKAGQTPLDVALEQGYLSVADYLLSQQRPVPLDVLSAVVGSGCPITWGVGTVRTLINGGADIHGVTTYGNGLLHRTVASLDEHRGLEMAKLLVGAGCNPFQHNVQGKTPLHIALDRGFPLLTNFLLSTGRPVPPDALSAILHSGLPAVWRSRTIRSLVGQGVNVRGVAADGDTLLHIALLASDESQGLEVAKLLVGAGCDPFGRNESGKTPLNIASDPVSPLLAHYLLSTGRPVPPDAPFPVLRSGLPGVWRSQTICSLVGQGVNVSEVAADGDTLLHIALLALDESQGLEVARLLVGAGCDPFQHNAQGKTPLDIALDRGFPLLADFLLSTGRPIPPNALFPVLRSGLPGVWRSQAIRSLVGQGINVNGIAADGDTLLHIAVLVLDESQGLEVAKLLVGAGCDPFERNAQGKAPHDLALDRKYSFLTDYLLSTVKFPPPDALFAILKSSLPTAWRAQTIRSLVRKGVDTSGLSAEGNTLLHATVIVLDEHQGLDVARLLVGTGCGPFARNKANETPFHIALKRGYSSIADYLLSEGKLFPSDALFSVLTGWCSMGWIVQNLDLFINGGADIHSITSDGNNLIHAVIMYHSEDTCLKLLPLLVSHGCEPSARNKEGETALHIAAKKGCISVVRYILSLDRSLPDDILFSVLKSPSRRKQLMLRMLINKGANTHATVDGNTLLHIAMSLFRGGYSSQNYLDLRSIVETLFDGGCDAFAPNSRGKTPLHLAVAEGYISTVEYLLSITTPPCLPADILACALDGKVARTTWEDIRAMLQLLIGKGADIQVRAADGGSLLHMAIKKCRPRLRTLLRSSRTHLTTSMPLPFRLSLCPSSPLSLTPSPPLSPSLTPCTRPTIPTPLPFPLSSCPPPSLSKGAAVWQADNDSYDSQVPRETSQPHCGESILQPAVPEEDNATRRLWHRLANHPSDDTRLEIIRILVDSGCDPSQCDVDGQPPLYYAVLEGHVDVVEYLLPRTVPLPQDMENLARATPKLSSCNS